ncbi:hypothetical protein [Rhodopila sp.]|uniref:hypothetical protein n=1 Tax=Rhodopila sp. TaxID=2480087 RepID=UPI003D1410D8
MVWVIENVLVHVTAVIMSISVAVMLVVIFIQRATIEKRKEENAKHGLLDVRYSPFSTEKMQIAIERYCRLAGWQDCPTTEDSQNRHRDRLLYREKYVRFRKGVEIANPVCIVRFAVEICGLDVRTAENCAEMIVRQQNSYALDNKATVEVVITDLLAETGDVFEAIEIANLLHSGCQGRDWSFWHDVHRELKYRTVGAKVLDHE